MAYEFRLPDIGEGVVEGEVVAWRVKEGDAIREDQPMVEVMTDKATVEIPSPKAGRVARLLVTPGQICKVGEPMIVIEETGATTTGQPQATPATTTNRSATSAPTATQSATAAPIATAPSSNGNGERRALATPATRRLARELGVDLGLLTGSGPAGRVTSDDVHNAASGGAVIERAIGGETVSLRRPGSVTPAASTSVPAPSPTSPGGEERIPFRGLRKKIAENMVRSIHTATHFTYVEEVDMTALVALRARLRKAPGEKGAKLSYLPFLVKAIVAALKKHPTLNSSLDEAAGEIVVKRYYHIGIATQTPQGLAVSVVRDADRRSLLDLAAEIERLATVTREGRARREELTGSTFTISSLGALGGLFATPIINHPEVAIVGVHEIKERPVVRDGQIVVRQLMNLSISLDHRVVDGYDGALFLKDVIERLEEPALLFLELG